jgi:hypothetical protein
VFVIVPMFLSLVLDTAGSDQITHPQHVGKRENQYFAYDPAPTLIGRA